MGYLNVTQLTVEAYIDGCLAKVKKDQTGTFNEAYFAGIDDGLKFGREYSNGNELSDVILTSIEGLRETRKKESARDEDVDEKKNYSNYSFPYLMGLKDALEILTDKTPR